MSIVMYIESNMAYVLKFSISCPLSAWWPISENRRATTGLTEECRYVFAARIPTPYSEQREQQSKSLSSKQSFLNILLSTWVGHPA
jgi:hypothetical protein